MNSKVADVGEKNALLVPIIAQCMVFVKALGGRSQLDPKLDGDCTESAPGPEVIGQAWAEASSHRRASRKKGDRVELAKP